MSFEQALLEASILPAAESTRAMLRFAAHAAAPTSTKGAEYLESELRGFIAPSTQLRVICDSDHTGFLVDAIRQSGNQLATLIELAEATTDALRPLEIGLAHVGPFFPEPDSLAAWNIMQKDSQNNILGNSVTEIAKVAVAQYRERSLFWMVEAAFRDVKV